MLFTCLRVKYENVRQVFEIDGQLNPPPPPPSFKIGYLVIGQNIFVFKNLDGETRVLGESDLPIHYSSGIIDAIIV
jgi:hypothetical protein